MFVISTLPQTPPFPCDPVIVQAPERTIGQSTQVASDRTAGLALGRNTTWWAGTGQTNHALDAIENNSSHRNTSICRRRTSMGTAAAAVWRVGCVGDTKQRLLPRPLHHSVKWLICFVFVGSPTETATNPCRVASMLLPTCNQLLILASNHPKTQLPSL